MNIALLVGNSHNTLYDFICGDVVERICSSFELFDDISECHELMVRICAFKQSKCGRNDEWLHCGILVFGTSDLVDMYGKGSFFVQNFREGDRFQNISF
jgi:hypothetical protein